MLIRKKTIIEPLKRGTTQTKETVILYFFFIPVYKSTQEYKNQDFSRTKVKE